MEEPQMEEVAGRKSTTTKIIIITCLINGILWVWCSYLLAYLGRTEIAESLSKVAITEIIGVVLVYCLKSLVENISKHNTWPDKGEKDTEETGAGDSGALND